MKKTKSGEDCFRSFFIAAMAVGLTMMISASTAFGAGRSGFPVAKVFMDPRALALAGACVSESGWSSGAVLNPAAAAGSQRGGQASFARHTLDLWSGGFGVCQPLGSNLVVGVNLSRFDYGEFEYIEEGVGKTGASFTAAENLLSVYYAQRQTSSLTWGLSAKYFWGVLENETASAGAVDAGFTFDPGWESVKAGGAVRNLGSVYSGYGAEESELPTEVVLGGSKKLEHLPLTLHAAAVFSATEDGDWTVDWLPGKPGFSFGAGGEFRVEPDGVKEPFFVRLGYNSRGQGMMVGHRLDLLCGFAFGLGLQVNKIAFDYTYAPMGALGDIHRFGVKGWF